MIDIKLKGLFENEKINTFIKEKKEKYLKKSNSTIEQFSRKIINEVRQHVSSKLKTKGNFKNTYKYMIFNNKKDFLNTVIIYNKVGYIGDSLENGVTIKGKNNSLLIPLLGGKRRGKGFNLRFKKMVETLSKNNLLFFKKENSKVIVFAKNVKVDGLNISRFKSQYRKEKGIKQVKRDEMIPIAIYVKKVTINKKTDFVKLSKDKWSSVNESIKKDFLSVF